MIAHFKIVLTKLDVTISVTRNFHIDNGQRIHKNDNMLETIFY